jgi:hypothetical protein
MAERMKQAVRDRHCEENESSEGRFARRSIPMVEDARLPSLSRTFWQSRFFRRNYDSKIVCWDTRIFVFLNNMHCTRRLAAIGMLLFITSCGKSPARIIEAVKEIPLSGGHDTIFLERSTYWDRGHSYARTDSNRQMMTFKPAPGDIAFVTLRNMGGVPLQRDTIRSFQRVPAERFLRTGTRDTTMQITIEFPDSRRPQTDVIVFIRNLDSAYREFLFYER